MKKRRFSPAIVVAILLGVGLIGVLAVGGMMASGWLRVDLTSETPTVAALVPSQTPTLPSVIDATETSLPATETAGPVSTASPTLTETPAGPSLPVLGGADKIALLNGNDIWVMNVDGSDPQRLTTDGAAKFNLQWLDRNTILYISGMTLKTVDIETLREENITSFLSSQYFESFHISPDGTQAAISLDRELFVVPFDLEFMRNVRTHNDLIALNGCLFYDAFAVKDALWSDDGTRLALKILVPAGNQRADAIRIIDITKCGDAEPKALDDFPIGRFAFKHTIVDFDYDGDLLFFLNSDVFKGGFGELVFYNTFTHKFQKVNPIQNTCCYRDATFSPDGTYVLFAFQDIRLGEESTTSLYYVRVDALTTGGLMQPIPLPERFFAQREETPMPVLRPAK